MIEEWFRWEREATIHPLFVPYTGSFTRQREYIGANWPTTLLIFKGHVVLWCNKIEPLHKFGQRLIELFMNSNKLNKVMKDFGFYIKKLKQHFAKIQKVNLSKLSNKKLLEVYNKFMNDYVDYWKIGMLAEPVAIQGERLIKENLKNIKDNKLFNQYLSILITTTKKSFSRQQEEDLLKIAIKIKGNLNSSVIKDLLKEHSKKYFWLHNKYYTTEVLDENFFLKELKGLLAKYKEPKKYLMAMEKLDKESINNKKSIIIKLKLNKKDKKLVKIIDDFGWFQDERKKYNMIADHYLDILLDEIGKRGKLSLIELKFTTHFETESILNGTFDKEEINKRMKNCLIVWEGDKDDYKIYTGKKAIKKEKQLFYSKEGIHEVTEIEGMTANTGRVRGYVKVTMSAKEAKYIKKGEVLVTSMTSPDFIAGIKNAAAIVTNEGGVTCHAAIISREFGIPCVIGTKIATKVLRTGDFVEVDGMHGAVRVLKKKA